MEARMMQVDPSVSRQPLPLDAKDLPTVCVLCSHNCGLRVDVENGEVVAVRADESHPVTHGYICNKGFAIPSYIRHAQRLQHPLRRRPEGGFERISWDEAIREIAAKLNDIRARHTGKAIGLVGVGGQGNHMDALYATSFLGAVGSKRLFNALAQEKTQHWLMDQWMFDCPPAAIMHPDHGNASFALIMGTNPPISNRGHNATDTFNRMAKDPSCKIVAVDPRETETTRKADRHLRVRPGTDSYLLLGIAATIANSEGLADSSFVHERTADFEKLRAELAKVDVAEMASRCGIETSVLVETARELAAAETAAIMHDLAVEQTPFSTLISYLIRVIHALTGNLGNTGGAVFVETAVPPEWSPKRFNEPERAFASGIQAIPALGGFPMFSPSLVPEEIMIDHPQRLRALVVEGANPILSYSDANAWKEAREKLDLLVVIEPTMTETARLADYVLPTPCGYEKWEFANFPKGYPEIYMQVRPPVVPGPEEALPEPEIYTRLVEAMGLVPEPPAKLAELAPNVLDAGAAGAFLTEALTASNGNDGIMLFWSYRTAGEHLPSPALTAMWLLAYRNALGRADAVVRTLGEAWKGKSPFEIGAELFRRILAHPEGLEIARLDPEANLLDHIGWEDKRIRLAPPRMLEEIARAAATPPRQDPDYPFVLALGLRTRWTANTIQRDPAWRKGRGPHCALNLSPADAMDLGVTNGDPVRVVTRRAAVQLPAAIDTKLMQGHVWIPNGFGAAYPKNGGDELEVQGVNLNELSDAADRDPISGCPHHKYTLCRVERM